MNRFLVAVVICISAFGLMSTSALAAEHTNPPVDEIKQKVADVAREKGIPPEILKAIAANESNYKQFDEDGTPHVSPDGGIGIMQVTPDNVSMDVDVEQLKTDLDYNIEMGAQVLLNKWELDFLPTINDHDKSVLEDWYFALAAYNGLSKANDPNENPGETYQEKIYERMENAALLDADHFAFPEFDIRYEDNNEKMFFPPDKERYETSTVTPSQQMYEKGDIVYINDKEGYANSREGSIHGEATKLWPYTPLKVTSNPVETADAADDYAYYQLEGVDVRGYVASAYLNPGSEKLMFNDPMDDNRAAALAFVSMNGYATGYPNGDFGSSDLLKREHVAVMLDSILSLDAPDSYEIQAADAESINQYRASLRKAEYNGLLGGGGKLRPKEYFTRAQMAQVMSKAFDSYYEKPDSMHSFEDADKIWNLEEVNRMYHNDVTIADPFRPNEDITRSQFALFIYRTMVDVVAE
ncbi:hypothetical protein EU245_08240 [Lentibacillus lipolyticus]|nr:hypothetical protein EU245_08240 [Lentibacillus lipolyticus]